MDIDRILNVEELRGRFLEHTRRAYRLLPPQDRPRILDIGCGQGLQTMELASLSKGEVIGIDMDEVALSKLRQRIDHSGFGNRVKAMNVSLYDNGFDVNSFDLLWEEGVLHLLDASVCLQECRRLLKPDGYLVMHETLAWFESIRKQLPQFGFQFKNRHMLPKHFWWTDYGALLEKRIRACREIHGDTLNSPTLTEHESVVAAIKSDPDQTDCGIYIVQKSD